MTVVVPTRDRPVELRRAIASIFAQDYLGDLTCVVVFDRTEPFDLSDMVVAGHSRTLVVTRNVRTPGSAGARNTGVDASFGDLIAFCDDSDEWLPGKLSAQVEALHAAPDAEVVLTGIELWREDVLTVLVPDTISVTVEALCRSRASEWETSTTLVGRETFETVIGPLDEACPQGYGENFEWLLRASVLAPLVVVRDPLVRRHEGLGPELPGRWQVIVDATEYLLQTHPELGGYREGRSRREGGLALAYAALGRAPDARRWALRCLSHWPMGRLPYMALAASSRLVRPATVRRWASRTN